MQTTLILATFILLYACQRLIDFWRALTSINNHPGHRLLLSPASILGSSLPRIKYVSLGRNQVFLSKHDTFTAFACDIHSSVSVFPNIRTAIVLADAAAIKEVTTSRARFPKPVHHYTALSFYGHNIVASEGEEWKKYRKISSPAFSNPNTKLVWDETVKIMEGLFTDVWGDEKVITVDHFLDVTTPIALFVISIAGFGRNVSWKEDEDVVIPPGHQMTFKQALHVVTTDFIIKLVVPNSALRLTKRLRRTKLAFDELHLYMSEMVRNRQTSEKVERYDLFSNLLEANSEDLDGQALTEDELISNIYVFLVAGHETTAHTVCFAMGLLALYPDEQEKLYQHIRSTIPSDRLPTYEDMPRLTHSMAVFYESLRLFPPVGAIPKIAAEDTTLTTVDSHGVRIAVPVPKGSYVTISAVGLHYNPRYWEDPHAFKPERFLNDWPRDAFVPFSSGARACLGKKFAETEGIAILTTLASRYKIAVKEEPQFAGETFEERKARVLATRRGLTVTPLRIPLVFTRRT